MSREIVACVASKPRWRRRRRSCSWLCSGSRSISSRMTLWRRAFMSLRVRMIIHRFLLIDPEADSCISILSDAYMLLQPGARSATPAGGDAAGAAARVAVAGATGYTGQELLRLLARHPACRADAAMSSGAASAARRAAGAGAHLGRRDHAARRRRARARRRPRVPGAARHGGGRARAGAGRGRRPRHRSVRRVPAARRRRARALVSGNAPRCRTASPTASPSASATRCAAARLVANPGCYPTAALLALAPLADAGLLVAGRRHHRRRQVGRVGRRQDAVGADALLRSATAACRRTACSATGTAPRSSRASARPVTVHAAPRAARPRHPGDDLRARRRRARPRKRWPTSTSAPTPARPSCGSSAPSLPEIKHVAHTNFCDIGWRVDPSGRAILVSVHRQPAEGRVGPGRAEHERDARPRRDDRACCERGSTGSVRSKFGGELLEDPDARLLETRRRRRSARIAQRRGTPLVDRARRRQGDRRGAEGAPASRSGRSTAFASPTTRRSTSSSRCWRARSTRGSWRR